MYNPSFLILQSDDVLWNTPCPVALPECSIMPVSFSNQESHIHIKDNTMWIKKIREKNHHCCNIIRKHCGQSNAAWDLNMNDPMWILRICVLFLFCCLVFHQDFTLMGFKWEKQWEFEAHGMGLSFTYTEPLLFSYALAYADFSFLKKRSFTQNDYFFLLNTKDECFKKNVGNW